MSKKICIKRPLQKKNSKTLLSDSKWNLNKRRRYTGSRIGRFDIYKVLILWKQTYRSNVIPASLKKIDKAILKFLLMPKKRQETLEKEKINWKNIPTGDQEECCN